MNDKVGTHSGWCCGQYSPLVPFLHLHSICIFHGEKIVALANRKLWFVIFLCKYLLIPFTLCWMKTEIEEENFVSIADNYVRFNWIVFLQGKQSKKDTKRENSANHCNKQTMSRDARLHCGPYEYGFPSINRHRAAERDCNWKKMSQLGAWSKINHSVSACMSIERILFQ